MITPLVSVICDVYNHEKYIENALDGILSQKTDFNFEILVHDDASTDRSRDIICSYEKKYPKIIKPLYQTVNQYSRGINGIDLTFQFPRVRGQFVAFCEGDDNWCCCDKMQKQIDAFREYPDVDFCAHAAYMKSSDKIIKIISPSENKCVLPLREVISGGGGYVATSSIMIRRKVIESLGMFYRKYPFDYSLQIAAAMTGGMIFIPEILSVYNYCSTGSSWSANCNSNKLKKIEWQKKVINMLEFFCDEYPWHRGITSNAINRAKSDLLLMEGKYRNVLTDKKMFLSLNTSARIKVLLGLLFGDNFINIVNSVRYNLFSH